MPPELVFGSNLVKHLLGLGLAAPGSNDGTHSTKTRWTYPTQAARGPFVDHVLAWHGWPTVKLACHERIIVLVDSGAQFGVCVRHLRGPLRACIDVLRGGVIMTLHQLVIGDCLVADAGA